MTDRTAALPPSERLHALDAVRGIALLAGVLFHASLAFLPGPQIWLVMDPSRSTSLSVLAFALHMFRLTTFFLVAGFFGRMMTERLGPKAFIRNRLRRIGLPLILFWPLVTVSIVAVAIWSASGAAGPPPPPPTWPKFPAFPLTHLWFLYDLLLLYAAVLLIRAVAVRLDRSGRVSAFGDLWVRRLASTPFGALAPAIILLPFLASQTAWPMFFGVQTPDMSLVPNPAAAAAFFLAFGIGWLLNRQPTVIMGWARFWPTSLAIALLSTGAALAIVSPANTVMPASHDLSSLTFYALYALGTWSWTMAFIGAALRFMSGHSPVRRYIADASYWVYIVHLPIVMALQVALAGLSLSWIFKLPILLALAGAFCFLSYHLLVRHSWIGAMLNGRRRSWKRAEAAAAPALRGGEMI